MSSPATPVAGLIAFRLLWGFVGGGHARFADFLPTPTQSHRLPESLMNGEPQHYVGHNPAGAVAIFLLLGFGITAAASGWATYNEFGGHFMEELHEVAANGMMAWSASTWPAWSSAAGCTRRTWSRRWSRDWKNIRNENPAG
jgi:cytochrome b